MNVQDSPKYRYLVDDHDELVWVDSWWVAFAQENGAAGLTKDTVLGRPLWDFIAGNDTCQLYKEIHRRLRSTGRPVVLPFRCDSPSLQRHMRMTITRIDDGQLLYECMLVRVESQNPLRLLDAYQSRSQSMLTMCSCCKRSLLESTGWLEVEEISQRLRLFEQSRVPALRYALCPDCADAMVESSDSECVS